MDSRYGGFRMWHLCPSMETRLGLKYTSKPSFGEHIVIRITHVIVPCHCQVMCSQYGLLQCSFHWKWSFQLGLLLPEQQPSDFIHLVMCVFGWYNWQTNFSIAVMVLDVGYMVAPRFAHAVTISSSASRNAFQHSGFPLNVKLPVISAPLQAWHPERAAVLAGLRAWTMGLRNILQWRYPLPVTRDVFWHNYGNLLRANTKTPVSGEMISILRSRATTALCLLPLCCSQGMPHLCGLLYIGCPIQLQRPWVSCISVLTWERSLFIGTLVMCVVSVIL